MKIKKCKVVNKKLKSDESEVTVPSLRSIFVAFDKGDDILLETHCDYSLLTLN